MKNESVHIPVLLKQSIEYLAIRPGGTYVDATLGGAGHTRSILESMGAHGKLVVFDVDTESMQRFRVWLEGYGWKETSKGLDRIVSFRKNEIDIYTVLQNFSNLQKVLDTIMVTRIDGILVDLGMSTDQIKKSGKGFSYASNEPLDMRMDDSLTVTAADLINGLYAKELIKLFKISDEQFASQIAHEIARSRYKKHIRTTGQLKQVIERVARKYTSTSRLQPATRVFQALRIAVNHELEALRSLLPQALEALTAGGRLVCLSFHSGEDRIVKKFIKEQKDQNIVNLITKKPIRPSAEEKKRNPNSSSAKLRVAEKL